MQLPDKITLNPPLQQWFGRMLQQWSSQGVSEKQKLVDEPEATTDLVGRPAKVIDEALHAGRNHGGTITGENIDRRDCMEAIQRQRSSPDEPKNRIVLAQKVIELSHSLKGRWDTAEHAVKRRILEMVCLNFRLEGARLAPEWRKPFDIFAEGLFVRSSQGDRI